MKQIISKLILRLIPRKLRQMRRGYKAIRKGNPGFSILKTVFSGRLMLPNSQLNYIDDYVRTFSSMAEKIRLDINTEYVYPLDTRMIRVIDRMAICSITVDFGSILKSDLRDIFSLIEKSDDPQFKKREESIIESIKVLASRIQSKLSISKNERAGALLNYFPCMLYREPKSLDEAIQKLLFYDALFWQMGHYHIGLGRLDLILKDYYMADINAGVLSESEAKKKLKTLIQILGKDTCSKSVNLIGDTGQYILLGGIDDKGMNVDNQLTEIFIDLMTELKIPDPKLILRVNKNTNKVVWGKAIKCIMTGIGSPLIMDEEPIMENMIKFGYRKEDVWNMGTSACWEPLIIGKSFDQNNPFRSVVAIRSINNIILRGKDYITFDSFLDDFKNDYKKEIKNVVRDLDFDCSPLFSLFFDNCLENGKDFTLGGAKYAYHGVQVVSFPNTINALLNIKRLVYEEKILSLSDCRKAIFTNYRGMEDIRLLLSTTGKKFGSSDDEVVDLTNKLIHFTGNVINEFRCNGQPVKVGFSSPNYIEESRTFEASLDGRKYGDPFAVHISPVSSKIDIAEILEFSSRLVYLNNCINGNVVDFILPSSYIKLPDKLVGILKNACDRGLFEVQLNVMDKSTLVDAKNHPEKYPNLIVRVWGFSAYFNDLPEEFKDNLIRRAEIYEAA